MNLALQALLEESIDYAGGFPPAVLPLAEAYARYLSYLESDQSWLLSRFVVRASDLPSLALLIKQGPPMEDLLHIAAIGSESAHQEQWDHAIATDGNAIERFEEVAGEFAAIESYEAKLPDLAHAGSYFSDLGRFDPLEVFAELPWGKELADVLAEAAESDFIQVKSKPQGNDPSTLPTASEMALFIQQCVQLGLPFKVTAGLHYLDSSRELNDGVRMHGYVNVLSATALAYANDLSRKEIETLINLDGPGMFRFHQTGISHGDWHASLEDIHASRGIFLKFGTASILEPLEALSAAGLFNEDGDE